LKFWYGVVLGDAAMRAEHASGLGHRRSFAVASGRSIWSGRLCRTARGLQLVAITLPVSGCSHAPTLNLLGSYFPAWMLCAAVGVGVAVVIRQILAVASIDGYVVAPLLTYAGFAVTATLLVWLLWFGH